MSAIHLLNAVEYLSGLIPSVHNGASAKKIKKKKKKLKKFSISS